MVKRTRFRGKVGQKLHFCKDLSELIKISFYDEEILLYSFRLEFEPNEDNIKSLLSIMRQKWNIDFKLVFHTFNEEMYEIIELKNKEQT